MDNTNPVTQMVRKMALQPVSPGVLALADHIRGRFSNTAQAILFYGSCLRSGDDSDGIVDLYVLVDSYRRSYAKHIWASLNKLLPPNVYYIEIPFEDRMVRAKYAVLSLADFQKGVTPDWFHSYIWGRFAQPTALVYARTTGIADQIHGCLARAVLTFVGNVVPQTPPRFSDRDLWYKGLSLSYKAELRAERPEKLVRLYDAAPDYYKDLTAAALHELKSTGLPVKTADTGEFQIQLPDADRRQNANGWRLRFLQGKLLSALRLLKGWATFAGGTEYILWKIKRHTGVSVTLTPHLHRHPLLAIFVIGWRLYRKGGFR